MKVRVIIVLSGVVFGVASLEPNTIFSLVLTWVVALCWVWGIRRTRTAVFDFYVSGLCFHLAAFSWLAKTIVSFGGFSWTAASAIFVLYCLVSALQFGFVGWLYGRMSVVMPSWSSLVFPLSWMSGECLVPRLFPWAFAHTQLPWSSLAALAEVGGVMPLSLLLLWWADIIGRDLTAPHFRALRTREGALAVVSAVLLLSGGVLRNYNLGLRLEEMEPLKIGIVQGNLSTEVKGDVQHLMPNIERYRKLTAECLSQGAELVVWPESVFNRWTPEDAWNIAGTQYDPSPGLGVGLLYGSLSFRRGFGDDGVPKAFNSAFGRAADGRVVGVYHKKVLMPFGEYLPFSGFFPWLKELSPNTGDFTRGDRDEPLIFEIRGGTGETRQVSIAVLICYEDLIPRLSVAGARQSAQLIANLTNDAWYGRTAAPFQHHLLASWRAVENRRYLIRATNTGLTGIVDPFGQTVADLPIFEEGTIVAQVIPLDYTTIYSIVGDWPVTGISLIVLGFAVFGGRRLRGSLN